MRHAKIKERKLKQEINRKRSSLLRQLDILYPQSCENCKENQVNNVKFICDCDAYVKIREIGNQLDELVAPRKCESDELLETLFVIENLTPELYTRLKYLKVTDVTIRSRVEATHKEFAEWKEGNGFTRVYRKGVKA